MVPTASPVAPVSQPPTQSTLVIGTDICACQPGRYVFQLNYSNVCSTEFLNGGAGIEDAACTVQQGLSITPTGDDAVPVSVNRIIVSELDRDLEILRQLDLPGSFPDGTPIEFNAFTLTQSNPEPIVPRGLNVVIFGSNSNGDSIENDFAITFENTCGDFPVLQPGDSLGWLTIVRMNRLFSDKVSDCPAYFPDKHFGSTWSILPSCRHCPDAD